MILTFVTKKDVNVNRYYIAADFDKKEYALNTRSWYSDKMIEINKKKYYELARDFRANGFVEKDFVD